MKWLTVTSATPACDESMENVIAEGLLSVLWSFSHGWCDDGFWVSGSRRRRKTKRKSKVGKKVGKAAAKKTAS